MLARILIVIGCIAWSAVAFIVTVWLTFPSQPIVDRLAYTVQSATDGDYALQASDAALWWTGLTLHDAKLMSVDPRTKEATLLFDADSVSARTSLFSLLSRRSPVYAVIDLGGSQLDVEAGFDRSGDNPVLDRLRMTDARLSVKSIGALLSGMGATIGGTGNVDVDVDLSFGSEVQSHEGRVAVRGKGLSITVSMPDPFGGGETFDVGPIAVSSLDFAVEARNGKVEIRSAELLSDHAHLNIEGDLTLDAFPNRSRIRGKAVLSNLGGDLATFESFLSSARWDDGTYHYTLACTLDRLSASCFRPDRQRRVATPRARSSVRPTRPGVVRPSQDDAQAEKLRQERERARQERLEERRARIEAARPNRPTRPQYDDEFDEEEELDQLDYEAGDYDIVPGEYLPGDMDMPGSIDPNELALPPDAQPNAGEDWE